MAGAIAERPESRRIRSECLSQKNARQQIHLVERVCASDHSPCDLAWPLDKGNRIDAISPLRCFRSRGKRPMEFNENGQALPVCRNNQLERQESSSYDDCRRTSNCGQAPWKTEAGGYRCKTLRFTRHRPSESFNLQKP